MKGLDDKTLMVFCKSIPVIYDLFENFFFPAPFKITSWQYSYFILY